MDITIIRASESDDVPQLGMMLIDGAPRFLTLELPWRDNQHDISCIPLGKYVCKKFNSTKFGLTFEVRNVPNRSGILFHAGNEAADTHGCILLGNRLVQPDFISGSKVSLELFRGLTIDVNEFNLEIKKWPKKC